jgi:hypothetical protein
MYTNLLDFNNDILNVIGGYVKRDNDRGIDKGWHELPENKACKFVMDAVLKTMKATSGSLDPSFFPAELFGLRMKTTRYFL